MLVVMKAHASAEDVRRVCDKIEGLGYRAHSIPGVERTAIGITGNKGEVEPGTRAGVGHPAACAARSVARLVTARAHGLLEPRLAESLVRRRDDQAPGRVEPLRGA